MIVRKRLRKMGAMYSSEAVFARKKGELLKTLEYSTILNSHLYLITTTPTPVQQSSRDKRLKLMSTCLTWLMKPGRSSWI